MAVKLRLKRMGKTNRPCYRVCAVDGRAPRDGAYIESIGFYDPFVADEQKKVRIDKERAEYWLSVGAQPSETVTSFLRKAHVTGLIKPRKPRKRRAKPASVKKRIAAKAQATTSKKAKKTKKTKPPKKRS